MKLILEEKRLVINTYRNISLTIDNTTIEPVNEFIYLGSTVSTDGSKTKDINREWIRQGS